MKLVTSPPPNAARRESDYSNNINMTIIIPDAEWPGVKGILDAMRNTAQKTIHTEKHSSSRLEQLNPSYTGT
jgi:hypothetical protein